MPGLGGQLRAGTVGVVALLITISMGALVLYSVTGALEVEEGSYADNAIHAVEEKGQTAFNLMTILAIVIVAATIIAVVVQAVGGYRGRREEEAPPAPAYYFFKLKGSPLHFSPLIPARPA